MRNAFRFCIQVYWVTKAEAESFLGGCSVNDGACYVKEMHAELVLWYKVTSSWSSHLCSTIRHADTSIPSVILGLCCRCYGDHFSWAEAVFKAGYGPPPIPARQLSQEKLEEVSATACQPKMLTLSANVWAMAPTSGEKMLMRIRRLSWQQSHLKTKALVHCVELP